MNHKTKGLIPDLRFPEFLNEREWELKIIAELGKIITGSTPSKIEKDYWGGHFNWITAQDFKQKYIDNSVLKITEKGKEKSRVIPKSSILVTCIASIGLNAINRVECATNQQINAIICNSNYNFEFIYYVISYNDVRLKNLAGRTAVPIINKSVFEKFKIQIVVNPKEQQKIAHCLSSLDEIITAQKEKLELLKNHKKGLMQNLFPQEGEKIPNFRFPEFKNEGEWKSTKMDKYIHFFSGIPIKGEDLCDDNSGIPILRGINITEGFIRHTKEIDKYYLGKDEKILKCTVKANDIVIGMDGSKVGKNVAIVKIQDENLILIQRVALIRSNENCDINYIYQHFLSKKFRNYVDKVNTSSGIPHISAQQIKDFIVGFPSLPEQQKIASCLSSLDELISSQTQKLEELQLHKKGLMQGLFPKILD